MEYILVADNAESGPKNFDVSEVLYTRIRILQKKFIKNCFWLKFFLRFVYVLVYGFKAMVKLINFLYLYL